MSINMASAMDDKRKHERWGKYYWSIDFELNQNLTETMIQKSAEDMNYSPELGVLTIGHNQVSLTEKETMKLIDTLRDSLDAKSKSYKLGLLLP